MPLELIIGAAVGAGLVSDKSRKTIRKGLVYGLAGALMAYDKMVALAAEVRGARTKSATTPAPTAPLGNEPAPSPSAAHLAPDPVTAHAEPLTESLASRF
jgi:hypothetical protein